MAVIGTDTEVMARTILEMSAHDLNNDIARVAAAAWLLRASTAYASMSQEDRDTIAALEQTSQRLQRRRDLTDDLIAWLRDPKGADSRLVDVDLDLAVARWAAADTRSSHVSQVRSSAPATVRATEPALFTLLDNIVGNALKYGASSVSVHVSTHGGRVVLSCHDDGSGFQADDLPHVFELGYRGPSQAGQVPGTGAGLAGCRLIAARLRADITAANGSTGGAVVSITFRARGPSAT